MCDQEFDSSGGSCGEKEDPDISDEVVDSPDQPEPSSSCSLTKKLVTTDSSPSFSPSPPLAPSKDDTDTSSSESITSTFSSTNSSNTRNFSTSKDTNSTGSNSVSTISGEKDSDDQKEGIRHKAVFDKVVLDASQRKHIREKHSRTNGTEDTSDSSSGGNENDNDLVVQPSHDDFKSESPSDTGISSWQEEYPLYLRQNKFQVGTSNVRHSRQKTGPLGNHYNNLKRPSTTSTQELWYDVAPSSNSTLGKDNHEREKKRKRFYRTLTTLRQCGLMEITMQTATLIEENRKLQQQIKALKNETATTYQQMLQIAKRNTSFLKQESVAEVMNNLRQIMSKNKEASETVSPQDQPSSSGESLRKSDNSKSESGYERVTSS